MNIIYNPSRYTCPIEKLYPGDTFIYDDIFCMLVNGEWEDEYCTAVSLWNGELIKIREDEEVKPINGKFVTG